MNDSGTLIEFVCKFSKALLTQKLKHGTTGPSTQNISDCGEGHLLEFDLRMALISPEYSASIFLKLSLPCTLSVGVVSKWSEFNPLGEPTLG